MTFKTMDRVYVPAHPDVAQKFWHTTWFVLAWHQFRGDTTVWCWELNTDHYFMIDAVYIRKVD